MENATKRIEYSYPSSPNACAYGFAKAGCYTVQVIESGKVLSIAGYATLEEARRHAPCANFPHPIPVAIPEGQAR